VFDDQHFRFPILGMMQLIAALPGSSLLLQNAVHRAGGAKIRALVQQGGKDLAGSPVLKAFRVQLVQDHLPLGGSQGTRRSRSRRCHGLRIGAELPVQRCVRSMLARTLLARQHEVTWWTSGFNHSAKCHRTPRTASVTTAEGIRLKLLRGVAYSRNVCIARLVNHYQLGQEFTCASDSEPKPDLIFCCWPTIELGVAAVRYAYRRSVPIILDVRDLWPHLYLDAAPQRFRPLARAALAPYFHMTRSAFRGCSAIVGISEGYLQWGLAHAGRPRGPWDAVFPLGYREPDLSRPPAPEQQEQLRSLGVDESRLLCWFLGSFGDTYDLESVILAAHKLESRGLQSYQFVLSGVGGKRAHCERLAGGLDNVVFTGWQDEDQITCMMRMARVGIAAYRKGAPPGPAEQDLRVHGRGPTGPLIPDRRMPDVPGGECLRPLLHARRRRQFPGRTVGTHHRREPPYAAGRQRAAGFPEPVLRVNSVPATC